MEAAGQSGSEVFVPEEPQVRALFDRVDDFIRRGNGAAAAQVLARISQAALLREEPAGDDTVAAPGQPGEGAGPGDPGADQGKEPPGREPEAELRGLTPSIVISSGAGLSIGATGAIRKALGRLSPEDQDRFRKLMEPVIAETWERTGLTSSSLERRVLRRRIIRDHPGPGAYPWAVQEEIDDALERGNALLALEACRTLLESADLFERAAQLRAASLGKSMAELTGEPSLIEEFEARRKAIAGEAAPGAQSPAARPRGGPRAVRSPSPAPSPADGASDWELGSVVWRSSLAERELRIWAAELTEPRGGPAEAGAQPQDVALPFLPAASEHTLLFQDSRRVLALRLPQLEEKWTHFLTGPQGEAINRFVVPALGPEQAIATQGERVVALDLEKGEPLWERAVSYDRRRRRLLVHLPGMEPPLAAQEARPVLLPGEVPAPEEAPPPAEGGEKPPAGDGKAPDLPDRPPDPPDRPADGSGVEPARERGEGGEEKEKAVVERRPVVSLGPPVLAGEAVVLTAWVKVQDETQLYAISLDARGGLRWTTGLGAYRSGDYLGQIAAPTPPLVRGPRVFVPTNLGVIAAVDLIDGATLWIRKYPRLAAAGRAEAVRSRKRWAPNSLIAWTHPGAGKELLLLSPQDSSLLLALSPEDGVVRWQVPRDRHFTLIGADAERCYLGGPQVSAIHLKGAEAGTQAWRWQPQRASPSLGRAALRGTRLLVSGNEALVQLDAATGRVLSTTLWDFRGGGGNLLPVGNLLAVAGAGELLVYDNRQRARERASRLPEEDRLLEAAKADLKAGELERAFEALTSWANLRPTEPPANSPLHRLRFELAEIAAHWIRRGTEAGALPEDDLALLHHYRVLLEPLAERKMVAAIDAARSRREAGDFFGAISHLEDALRLTVSPSLGPETSFTPVPYPVNDFLSIPSAEAIRDQLLLIRDGGPRGQAAFARFEDRGDESLREARRIGTQPAFRRVIDGYPFTRAALQARRELAEYLLNQQNPGEAIRCLLDLLSDHPQAQDFVTIKLRVADLLVETRRYSEGREVLLSLLRERPGDIVVDPAGEGEGSRGERESTVRQVVESRLADPQLRDARRGGEVSPLRFPLRKRWRSPANLATSSRLFLRPEGSRPEHLAGTFFTRSRESIECRRVSDGYLLWTVELSLVPGFTSAGSGAGFFFNAPPRMPARYCGDLLVVQDARNLLGIESRTGRIRWHKPFGRQEEAPPAVLPRIPGDAGGPEAGRIPLPPGPELKGPELKGPAKGRGRILPLSETVRGFTGGPEGVFVTTSRRRLLAFDLDGKERWERTLDFEPASDAPPELAGEELAVFQEAPAAAHFLAAATGNPLARVEVQAGPDARFIHRPLVRTDRLAFLAMPDGFHVLNLATRKLRGSYRPRGTVVQKAWSFPDLPGQALLHVGARGTPALVGVDIDSGRELWRFEKFPGRSSELSVHCDGNRLYVIHGEDKWSLLLLELRSGPERGRYSPLPLWPHEISVGTFFSREAERQVLISQDALFISDPGTSSVNVYDKLKGSNRSALAGPITRFLVDKRSSRFGMDIVDDVLVLLTEGGDCGFDAMPLPGERGDPLEKTMMVKRFIEKADDWDNVGKLAGRFFIDGDEESALTLLNRALLSEGLPSLLSPGRYQLLSYMLNGIKEEAMKEPQNRLNVSCRKFRASPLIDGELNDSWNYTSRIEMRNLRHVGLIPSPGQASDVWAGEDDLSATLYTGWDDEHFYFALDVEDSQIYPYDKEAEFWKGDCLIIGLDPTGDGGFFQRGGDQLLTLALTVPKRKLPGKGKDGDKDDEDEDSQKPKGLFSVKKKDDNSGVIYEVGMPWSSFSSDESPFEGPAPGVRFGLSLVLTDDDSGQGAAKTLSPAPCHLLPRDPKRIWRFLIPEYFPKVTLE